jgi:hypothetical protein
MSTHPALSRALPHHLMVNLIRKACTFSQPSSGVTSRMAGFENSIHRRACIPKKVPSKAKQAIQPEQEIWLERHLYGVINGR